VPIVYGVDYQGIHWETLARSLQLTDILLVVPPFLNASGPALGAEVLAQACRERGMACEVLYANLAFAAHVGESTYRRVMNVRSWREIGEAAFAPEVFDNLPDPTGHLFAADQMRALWEQDGDRADDACYRTCREAAPGLVSETVAAILERRPRIVGFSAVCQQTLASLAIAKKLKAVAPKMLTVLGGTSTSAPTGEALADIAPMLDCVVGGEADVTFPALCWAFLADGTLPARVIESVPLQDLDEASTPDLTAYHEQLRPFVAAGSLPAWYPAHLIFESSRGCWWGDRVRCSFCGLPNSRYRRKSASRVLDELRALNTAHGDMPLWASDCVMPREVARYVVPRLIEEGAHADIQYEVRADLSSADAALLSKLGSTWIQPGIESLCPSVLRAFRKGVRASQSLRLLRECRSLGMAVAWNHLYRVPEDDLEEYRRLTDLLPALHHLHPPMSFSSVSLVRHSPYYEERDELGFTRVRPVGMYRYLYPPKTRYDDIAIAFRATWPSALDAEPQVDKDLGRAISDWMDSWRGQDTRPALYRVALPGGRVFIQDSRDCARQPVFLGDDRHATALEFLETPRLRPEVQALPSDVLTELLDLRFIVHWDDHYLSLVTRARAAHAPATREGLDRRRDKTHQEPACRLSSREVE
jgi:ribosomal peptide maturation radical SAM protein 1